MAMNSQRRDQPWLLVGGAEQHVVMHIYSGRPSEGEGRGRERKIGNHHHLTARAAGAG